MSVLMRIMHRAMNSCSSSWLSASLVGSGIDKVPPDQRFIGDASDSCVPGSWTG